MEMISNEEKITQAVLVSVDTGDYDAEASLAELKELVDNCTWTWGTLDNGVKGYKVTSNKNGNSIFF